MPFTQMTAPGILLIGIGLALVCAGLAFWPGAPRSDTAVLDSPDEFRTILDALDEEDHRDESWDLDEVPAKQKPIDSAIEATTQLNKQRRPRLG